MKKVLVLAACMLFLMAGVAQTAYSAILVAGTDYNSIPTTVHGSPGGGSFDVSTINPGDGVVTLPFVYCVDLVNGIAPAQLGVSLNANVTYDGTIHGGAITNAGAIAWLIDTYGTSNSANRDQAIALQAAIWHEIDSSYVLNGTSAQNTLYSNMLTALGSKTAPVSYMRWISPFGANGAPLQGMAAPVPIPGTLVLLGSGLAGLVGIGRFRRKRPDK